MYSKFKSLSGFSSIISNVVFGFAITQLQFQGLFGNFFINLRSSFSIFMIVVSYYIDNNSFLRLVDSSFEDVNEILSVLVTQQSIEKK